MSHLTINQVIDILGSVKENGKRHNMLNPSQIDALNLACNILESNFELERNAEEAIRWTYWRR